ncbi:MAG TPA: hypothetical protein VD902_03015 [Symbiobacteriaceae bacterium]|nr:hypothetical protein [Symbiobacteriaceae bacterium]
MAPFLTTWYPWISLFLILVLFYMVGVLSMQVAALRGGYPRSRQELENAYTAGKISRDDYERLKDRVR